MALTERTHPDRSPGDSNRSGPSSATAGGDVAASDSTPRPSPWLPVSVASLVLLAALAVAIRSRRQPG